MRVNRRDFLKTAAAAGATLTAAACGGGSSSAGTCDPNTAPATKNACPAPGLPDDSYFQQLQSDFIAAGIGTPQIFIDLDRLDANAAAIVEGTGASRYRIVEKSLPSLDLLEYVSNRTNSSRFLVLHLPFLPALLTKFPNAQILIGKPQPTAAVQTFFQSIPPPAWPDAVARVRFLVDSVDRLNDLMALATTMKLPQPLQVGVEVDVGLHRGGVRSTDLLPAVLSIFATNTPKLTFAGMLGYDGHVVGAPASPGNEEAEARAAFKLATSTYQSFVDVLTSQFASLVRDDLIFNSGGSETFPLYTSGPVNDVAAGGGLLRPNSYTNTFIASLTPALFLTTPVLAHFDKLELPFINPLVSSLTDGAQGFTIYGGGWAAVFVYPPNVALAPFVSDTENENLVPNQAWMYAPPSPALGPGDWIFQQPRKADAIFQFENIMLVRGGRLQTNVWKAYPRRY